MQLRTLQRRDHEWRALHGPGKEIYFEQRHEPGREGAFDFTDANELGITIAGRAFEHLLFQFVLTFSKWRWVGLAFSETFEALIRGLQGALFGLRGVPRVLRSDNLSVATHQIQGGGRVQPDQSCLKSSNVLAGGAPSRVPRRISSTST